MQFTAGSGAGSRVVSRSSALQQANIALVAPCNLPALVRGGAKLNRVCAQFDTSSVEFITRARICALLQLLMLLLLLLLLLLDSSSAE